MLSYYDPQINPGIPGYYPLTGGGVPVNPYTPNTPTPVTPPTTPAVPNTSARDNALARARLGISQELQRRGLAPNAYQSEFDQYLNSILGVIPQDATNFDEFFTPNLASDVLSGIQAGQRNQYRGQVQNQFGTNFGTQQLPDTFLDDLITNTLNSQYNAARETLDRGVTRGQYNQRGFNAGISALDNARTANMARLNTIEGDILSGYRTRLGDVRNNAFNAATGYQLGDNFNLDDYLTQAEGVVNTARANAPGEFLNALGTTPLFDLGNIGNAAGQAQGAVNLNNMDVREGQQRRSLAAARGRGLGSQGGF